MRVQTSLSRVSLNILLLFLFAVSIAANATTPDTLIHPRKPYKLSQKQFLERYGTDSTSRSLIRYGFRKHRKNAVLAIYYGVSTVLAGGLAGLILLTTTGNLLTFLILITLLAAIYVMVPVVIISGIFLLLNSRKRLYRWVQRYQQTGEVPRRLSQKKAFLR